MKKLAFIILLEQSDKAEFQSENYKTDVYMVKDFGEAKMLAKKLSDDGYEIIELCGAFGKDRAREYYEMCGGKTGFGYVVHDSDQDGVFADFFA